MAPPDWKKIEAFLVGRCGMTQAQAARTSALEIQHLLQGDARKQQELWEIARWIRWHDVQYNPYVKSGSRPATPRVMLPFPWETDIVTFTPKDCHVTDEEAKELTRIFTEMDRKNKAAS